MNYDNGGNIFLQDICNHQQDYIPYLYWHKNLKFQTHEKISAITY
jgi:hypothetical protein